MLRFFTSSVKLIKNAPRLIDNNKDIIALAAATGLAVFAPFKGKTPRQYRLLHNQSLPQNERNSDTLAKP